MSSPAPKARDRENLVSDCEEVAFFFGVAHAEVMHRTAEPGRRLVALIFVLLLLLPRRFTLLSRLNKSSLLRLTLHVLDGAEMA